MGDAWSRELSSERGCLTQDALFRCSAKTHTAPAPRLRASGSHTTGCTNLSSKINPQSLQQNADCSVWTIPSAYSRPPIAVARLLMESVLSESPAHVPLCPHISPQRSSPPEETHTVASAFPGDCAASLV
ncbi:hypothetical protein H920_11760 [Fukomys damarensis]|uniref:Uncharacterized protein n=1 Tax=Fukomys damarensis TaxID=885580 RepID=A0A091D9C6_FUKDA|nr:hypothetical protein H920_11760 [Fukomys damarensis]